MKYCKHYSIPAILNMSKNTVTFQIECAENLKEQYNEKFMDMTIEVPFNVIYHHNRPTNRVPLMFSVTIEDSNLCNLINKSAVDIDIIIDEKIYKSRDKFKYEIFGNNITFKSNPRDIIKEGFTEFSSTPLTLDELKHRFIDQIDIDRINLHEYNLSKFENKDEDIIAEQIILSNKVPWFMTAFDHMNVSPRFLSYYKISETPRKNGIY
jgi:hypothetical protein